MGGFWWFLWTHRVMWNISYLALSSQKWLSTPQKLSRLHPSLCLPSWSRGGQECPDGWFPVVPMDPEGHGEHLLLSTLLPEVALNPSNPIKTPPVLMLFSWSCGGQGCPDDFFKGHS